MAFAKGDININRKGAPTKAMRKHNKPHIAVAEEYEDIIQLSKKDFSKDFQASLEKLLNKEVTLKDGSKRKNLDIFTQALFHNALSNSKFAEMLIAISMKEIHQQMNGIESGHENKTTVHIINLSTPLEHKIPVVIDVQELE